jgi:hypothetical protein
MDPLTPSVVFVLGNYAFDQGATLAREVGPHAMVAAKEISTLALERLRRQPRGEVLADEFEAAPETYQKPVEKKLAETSQADPDFAAQLQKLMAQYETAAKEHPPPPARPTAPPLQAAAGLLRGRAARLSVPARSMSVVR